MHVQGSACRLPGDLPTRFGGLAKLRPERERRCASVSATSSNPVAAAPSQSARRGAVLGRLAGEGGKVRRGDFRYEAKSWKVERRVIAVSRPGLRAPTAIYRDESAEGCPALCEKAYCARGRPSLIKAQAAPRLASEHCLLRQSDRQPVPAAASHRRDWLMHTLRGLAPKTSFWHCDAVDTVRLSLFKVAVRVTDLFTKIKDLAAHRPLPINTASPLRRSSGQTAAVIVGARRPLKPSSPQPSSPKNAPPAPP